MDDLLMWIQHLWNSLTPGAKDQVVGGLIVAAVVGIVSAVSITIRWLIGRRGPKPVQQPTPPALQPTPPAAQTASHPAIYQFGLVITALVILFLILPSVFLSIFWWPLSPPKTAHEVLVLFLTAFGGWIAFVISLALITGFSLRDIWSKITDVTQRQAFIARVKSSPTRICKATIDELNLLIILLSVGILLMFWLRIQIGDVVYKVNVQILFALVALLFFLVLTLIPRVIAPIQVTPVVSLTTRLLRFICLFLTFILAVIMIFSYTQIERVQPPTLSMPPTPIAVTLTPTPTSLPTLVVTQIAGIQTPTLITLPTYTPVPKPTSRPIVIVFPYYGSVGTKFQFNGSGFSPNELIQRYIAGPSEEGINKKYAELESIRADTKGNFELPFVPDGDWQAGTYIYIAQDTYTDSFAATSFVITLPPSLKEPTKTPTLTEVPTFTQEPPTSRPPTSTPVPPTSTPTPTKRSTPTPVRRYTPTPYR